MLSYTSIEKLCSEAQQQNTTVSDIVFEDQCIQMGKSKAELIAQMTKNLEVMLDSIEKGSCEGVKSRSGLTGGDAYRLKQKIEKNEVLCGGIISHAIQMAVAVAEINAAMGKIVAAPTAGSCGIVPATLGAMIKVRGVPYNKAVMSLFGAGAVGMVVAENASIAGASGGCQAECGTASAMAAACIVELCGGTPEMVSHAVAIAIKCVLGLVCDPVAGLVEIPCIKRNASGVSLAFTAAELALAGIKSAIPADEVIATLKRVGEGLPAALRETAEGGLAITPTGLDLQEKVFGSRAMLSGCSKCSGCI